MTFVFYPDPRRAFDAVGDLITKVRPGQWSAPTPCTDWTVRQLANHLIGMIRVFTALLADEPPPHRPAPDYVEDDPIGAYRDSAVMLQAAFDQPGVLERSYHGPLGTATGADLLQIRLYDLLAHGWDLAQATGQSAELPDDLAEQSLALVRTQLTDQAAQVASAEPRSSLSMVPPSSDWSPSSAVRSTLVADRYRACRPAGGSLTGDPLGSRRGWRCFDVYYGARPTLHRLLVPRPVMTVSTSEPVNAHLLVWRVFGVNGRFGDQPAEPLVVEQLAGPHADGRLTVTVGALPPALPLALRQWRAQGPAQLNAVVCTPQSKPEVIASYESLLSQISVDEFEPAYAQWLTLSLTRPVTVDAIPGAVVDWLAGGRAHIEATIRISNAQGTHLLME